MTTNRRDDASASEIGDRLPERAAGREHPRLQAPAAPVTVPAPRAAITARAATPPGERAVTDRARRLQHWERQASAKPCWLCGIRLPAEQMVPDGGSACPDLRWYCRDTRACTERWTSRPTRPTATGERTARARAALGEQARVAAAARPAPV